MRVLGILLGAVLVGGLTGAARVGDPPNACTVLPTSDITAALGAGWTPNPPSLNANTSDLSSCMYTHGMHNLVAFTIVRAPGGDAKGAVATRKASVSPRHAVTAFPALCEGGFAEVLTKSNTTVYTSKGEWEVMTQVEVNHKPDVETAVKLTAGACKRL